MVGVIAKRDRVDAVAKQLLGDLRRDAKAAGDVLAVDHHERGRITLAQDRQALQQRVAADAADEIADEQDAHVACAYLLRRLWLSHTLPIVRAWMTGES